MAEKKKILVVEDEAAISKLLMLKLGFAGFEPTAAYDGQEGLDQMEKEKYDLILLDLMMPKIDGFGVLTEMRKRGYKIPVIVATNLNQPSDIMRVMELGCTNYYVKSDTPLDQIVEIVKSTLNG